MDDSGGDAGEHHEQEHEQAVIGAAALGDGHDGEEGHAALQRHAVADHGLCHRRERIDELAGEDAGEETKRGERQHRGEREGIGLMRAAGGLAARAPKKGDAEGLDEAGRGKCR